MKAIDYYSINECIITTLSQFKKHVADLNTLAESTDQTVFWRGQMDHEWPLTSSLVRKLSVVAVPDDKLLNAVEDKILDEANKWIDDLKNLTSREPLAQLAYLQHHGIPTRLLDFTTDSWMAMFFACEGMDHTDGRIFAHLSKTIDVLKSIPTGTPWRSYDTDKIAMWDPIASNVSFPRVKAQSGYLAVGRLPSTKPRRVCRDSILNGENRDMLAEEVRRTLSIPFRLGGMVTPTGIKKPVGLTFRIHVDKESVRRDLSGKNSGMRTSPKGTSINHKVVYPDAAGMVACSDFLKGLSKGVLII